MYQETEYRTIALVNDAFAPGQIVNAVCHLALGVNTPSLDLQAYRDFSQRAFAMVSRFPVVVLKPKRESHLQRILQEADAGVLVVRTFTDRMFGNSSEEQVSAYARDAIEQHRIVAILLHGATPLLGELTKRFSLYGGAGPVAPVEDHHLTY